MRPKWFLQEEEGGGEQGGAGGAGDKGEGKGEGKDTPLGQKDLELVIRGMAILAKGQSELQAAHRETLDALKGMGRKPDDEAGGDKGDKGSKGDLFEGVDMEQLDRKEFAAMLLTKFDDALQRNLKAMMKPVEERIGQIDERVSNDLAGREISAAADKRPDFMEWRSEIAELVKDNPRLSVTRAYTIARAEHADKAKDMDKKYSKAEPAKPSFTGFTPTRGGGRGEGATRMKFSEAAEKAYDEVLAELGGANLDNLPIVGGKSS